MSKSTIRIIDKGLTRITVETTKNFRKEIKQYVLDHNMTITELIHKSIRQYMNQGKN